MVVVIRRKGERTAVEGMVVVAHQDSRKLLIVFLDPGMIVDAAMTITTGMEEAVAKEIEVAEEVEAVLNEEAEEGGVDETVAF